ncbi:MAG: bifunctional YncE family protein/alkaline phosphatase family protein, partial [Planctomycetota bacterium]
GATLYGLAVTSSDDVWYTSASDQLHRFVRTDPDDETPGWELKSSIALPSDSFPCGLALADKDTRAYVCLSKRNTVAVVDLLKGEVLNEIPSGIAPFDVVVSPTGKQLFVSNLGGRKPQTGDVTATSGGSDAVVDERGIASTGTVSVISLDHPEKIATVEVGLHPSVVHLEKDTVWVCNTNQDTVSELGLDGQVRRSIVTKPDDQLAFGSMPNALATSPDGKLLFVALAGNNAIAVIDLLDPNRRRLGLIPTAWFPSGLDCDDEYLFIANTKGFGSRSRRRDAAEGRNSHDHQGVVQRVPLTDLDAALATWTESTLANGRVLQALKGQASPVTDASVPPVPVPEALGAPSVFKHVIYVIKENRTFDQVFGDLNEARSDPELCIFPDEITPNHHALARRFGILDNYYCNGILSADGHSWATEGNVTPYLERAFGKFARSYTFGDDPLTYSSSGFVWDHVLAAGLTFRNYGEMDYATPPDGMAYQEIWDAYRDNQPIEFAQNIGIERLRRYSCRDYPGWNMVIPDVLRMDRFLKEFREFEAQGNLPNLMIVYLPQDHLGGGVTSRAHMADNDLALGKLVEAVSQSSYWNETVIFVNEDDPQNGYDHIDGHRSLCLVISPYSKPGVNHDFFNQTSVLRTLLHLFGLPPMNQQEAAAPLMTSCFTATATNHAPYQALAASVPLNERPQPKSSQSRAERHWRQRLATVPIERTGMKTPQDEDHLNRFVWHEQRGWSTPYPVDQSGPHGRGLKPLGLTHSARATD